MAIVRPFFIVNQYKRWRQVTIAWNVETVSVAIMSGCLTSTLLSFGRHPASPARTSTRCMLLFHQPLLPFCLVRSLIVCRAASGCSFRVRCTEALPHRGTMPIEQKRVRTDHASLMGPAKSLLYPTRFQWGPNEPEVIILRDPSVFEAF